MDHGVRGEKKRINKMRNKFSEQYKAVLVMQMFSAALFGMLLVPLFKRERECTREGKIISCVKL